MVINRLNHQVSEMLEIPMTLTEMLEIPMTLDYILEDSTFFKKSIHPVGRTHEKLHKKTLIRHRTSVFSYKYVLWWLSFLGFVLCCFVTD